MKTLSAQQVSAIASLIGSLGENEEKVEREVLALVGDQRMARRASNGP